MIMLYKGYTAQRIIKNDKPIWKILKDEEFITNMFYYKTDLDNLKKFNELINLITI